MLENLRFETSLSRSLNPDLKRDTIANGRYYHLEELDSICPSDWRLPSVQDWLSYYRYLDRTHSNWEFNYEDLLDKHVYRIDGYEGTYDPFEIDNPLRIKNTGWIQGDAFSNDVPHLLATYWITTLKEGKVNRSHIHITPMWTNFHQHKHHLKVRDEKTLRRFMVRCVKD